MPMMPVEQTSMSRGSQPSASAAAAHIASASARPLAPVPALALPRIDDDARRIAARYGEPLAG